MLIGLLVLVPASMLAADEHARYEFAGLWPPLQQPWYFFLPEYVALGPGSVVYVSDTARHRVRKFTEDGQFLTEWGNLGSGVGEFDHPKGVAVDAAGFVYVSDSRNYRVQKFTSDGVFVMAWGMPGTADGYFNGPEGIAAAPDGTIYVVDAPNHRVQHFSNEGDFLRAWGTGGGGPV